MANVEVYLESHPSQQFPETGGFVFFMRLCVSQSYRGVKAG